MMDNNEETFETRSVCSNTSHANQCSSASAIAARAHARAEAELKYTERPKPDPHQDSKLPEPTPAPMHQPTVDNGEAAENKMKQGGKESSESSCYDIRDVPYQQTFTLMQLQIILTPKARPAEMRESAWFNSIPRHLQTPNAAKQHEIIQ